MVWLARTASGHSFDMMMMLTTFLFQDQKIVCQVSPVDRPRWLNAR